MTTKKVTNDRYIRINNYAKKREFNEAAQKGKIRVVSDAFCEYTKNQDVTSAGWIMEARPRKEKWEGPGLINAEQNSSYGGEGYDIYILLRFILEMLDVSKNQEKKNMHKRQ